MTDLIAWPVAEAAATCLCAAWVDDPDGKPGRCCVLPGRDVAIDDCCAGQAWVRVARVYPTSGDTFPDPAIGGQDTEQWPLSGAGNCDDLGVWAVQLGVGVARCAPVPDDNGNPPSCDELDAAARRQADDRGRSLKAIMCCLARDVRVLMLSVGEWQPAGPAGGCVGGEWQVTVMVNAGSGWTETQAAVGHAAARPATYVDGDDDD